MTAPRNIYLASSWRNPLQPLLVHTLRREGHTVYDFRHPAPGNNGFSWKDAGGTALGPHQDEDADTYLTMLEHPVADAGYTRDFEAMVDADTFVLALPCGRSAHLEAGWAIGTGRPTAILITATLEPELMYLLADLVTPDIDHLIEWLEELGQ